MSHDARPIMQVKNLKKHYPLTKGFLKDEIGRIKAVDGISFDLSRGETLGIVGESGCGKSTAATSMIRLEEPTDGEIIFDGEDITEYDNTELKRFRRKVQMIFQDPDSSFDPRMNVGDAVAEPLVVQGMADGKRREEIVADLLERVGLSKEDIKRFPHEFSGGQKQRIALARALAVNPDIIVADEPVSALDVSIQSEILALMKALQEEFGLTIVVISHNLGVVQEICDRVAVMYLGEFVETGPTEELFEDPQHPYTRALLSAIPVPDPNRRGLGTELKGDVPDPGSPPSGCRFHTRCPEVIPPTDVDIPQEDWRSVLHFRERIRNGTVDPSSLGEIAAVEGGLAPDEFRDDEAGGFLRDAEGSVDVTRVPGDLVRETIQREYDLPEALPDPEPNEALEKALERITEDDIEGAREALDSIFVTPCELDQPELLELSPGHEAACHLHEGVEANSDELRRALEEKSNEIATSD